jgi:hypothetical protein
MGSRVAFRGVDVAGPDVGEADLVAVGIIFSQVVLCI